MGKSKELAELGDVVTQSGGKVGIGTSSPSQTLHVVNPSTSYVLAETTGTGTSAGVRLKGDASADYTLFTTQGTNQFAVYDNAAGTTRMTIDASGRVTMPYQPSFYVRLLTNVTTRNAVVVFNEVRLNNGGGYNVSNGRYTAPVSGVYLMTAGFLPNVDNASYAYIQVNGTRYSERIYNQYADQHSATSLHVALDAGDYVEFYTVGDGTEAFYCHFGGHLIG